MDITALFEQHGPTGILAAAVLLFVRQLLAGGIKITVTHNPDQVAAVKETFKVAAAEVMAQASEVHAEHAEQLASHDTRITKLEVTVDERTAKKLASSGRPPSSATKTAGT